MTRNAASVLILAIVTGCKTLGPVHDYALDDGAYSEAIYLPDQMDETPLVMERIEPIAMIGQLKPVYNNQIAEGVVLKPHQAIDKANASAAIEPDQQNFINAIQIYPYTIGALYQVYTAPEQITDIALQPGEELMSVSAGDTLRWVLGDTISGSGQGLQTHILVKPTKSGLKTNLIIATSKRTYHLELTSYRETYMAAVSWRYPHEQLLAKKTKASKQRKASKTAMGRGLSIDRLNFRYEIDGDSPPWRPLRAFDDGRKVYIQFPARLDQGEAPPLFIVGRNGESQLVNYRVKDSYYVVDRLFAAAELRLGEKDQQVVRILRSQTKAEASR
ncbi:MAG: P-type conjugative transfer protein TrbG [Pseudomonadota bacterium]